MSELLKAGTPAPDFEAVTHDRGRIRLSDFRGNVVVLYFYPKDNTPGCTKEACGFRDVFDDLKDLGVVVLGVSKDSVKSHESFAKKYGLPFSLVADPEGEVISKFGAWKQKSMFGKSFLGIRRVTYLIGRDGVIAKVFPDVKPEEHAKEVLEAVRGLQA
jgi:peroxiredoxin Q/BCP